MNASNPLVPPIHPKTRNSALSVRLTEDERAAIDTVAQQMKVTPSHFARHFLLRIAAHFAAQAAK